MSSYSASSLPDAFFERLRETLSAEHLRTDPAHRWAYSYDNSRRQSMPCAVAVPASHDQVVAIVRACNEFRVPLTARGLGTGTTGAAVPEEGGLVVSTERMTRCDIDVANRVARVGPGITNGIVQRDAASAGFFWPPDPTSADYSTVGGNLACNAAGPRAVKYGTARENTLGLRAVSGDGLSLRTGCYTTKGVVGYDLTRLFIGSEGTLGIITEATLKLCPLPEAKTAHLILYRDVASAAQAVTQIMAQPVVPCALEYMDDKALNLIRDYARVDIPTAAGAMLVAEVDGTRTQLAEAGKAIAAAARTSGMIECKAAGDEEQSAALWRARKALSPALRTIAPGKINEDVVVPVSEMAAFVTALQALSAKFEIPIVTFGHAGNGNLHVNLLIDPSNQDQVTGAQACLREMFVEVIRRRGTLSGEHGIGYEKRQFLGLEIEPETLDLMRRIKGQFDPNGVLNPGKIFPA